MAYSASNYIGTLSVQADGSISVGGVFSAIGAYARYNVARLDGAGNVIGGFGPNVDQPVATLSVQPDGKLMLGGYFTQIDGVYRNHLARLSEKDGSLQSLSPGSPAARPRGAARAGLAVSDNSATWLRGGSAPELALPPQIAVSLDGVVYGNAVAMTRIDGGWNASGFALPTSGTYYLRTRGQLATGGLIESVTQGHAGPADRVFANGFE